VFELGDVIIFTKTEKRNE